MPTRSSAARRRSCPHCFARVDGKSPVEYLVDPGQKAAIRAVARRFLRDPAAHPDEIATALTEEQQT